jgi:hypothetical protein
VGDEEKDIQKPIEADAVNQETQIQSDEEKADAAKEAYSNHVAEKRGRMIATGIIAGVILSVIAFVVAVGFQATVKYMTTCPTDLPVNDPAKVLWQEVVSSKDESKSLGVSKALLTETRFKGLAPDGK